MNIAKEVWLGADNFFVLRLMQEDPVTNERVPVDLSAADKMELYLTSSDGSTYSIVSRQTDVFRPVDWLANPEDGQVRFQLGVALKDLEVPPLSYAVELQIYDYTNTAGVVWFSRKNRELMIKVSKELVLVPTKFFAGVTGSAITEAYLE